MHRINACLHAYLKEYFHDVAQPPLRGTGLGQLYLTLPVWLIRQWQASKIDMTAIDPWSLPSRAWVAKAGLTETRARVPWALPQYKKCRLTRYIILIITIRRPWCRLIVLMIISIYWLSSFVILRWPHSVMAALVHKLYSIYHRACISFSVPPFTNTV